MVDQYGNKDPSYEAAKQAWKDAGSPGDLNTWLQQNYPKETGQKQDNTPAATNPFAHLGVSDSKYNEWIEKGKKWGKYAGQSPEEYAAAHVGDMLGNISLPADAAKAVELAGYLKLHQQQIDPDAWRIRQGISGPWEEDVVRARTMQNQERWTPAVREQMKTLRQNERDMLNKMGVLAKGEDSIVARQADLEREKMAAMMASQTAGAFDPARARAAAQALSTGMTDLGAQTSIARSQEQREAMQQYAQQAGQMMQQDLARFNQESAQEEQWRQFELAKEQLAMQYKQMGLGDKYAQSAAEQELYKLLIAQEQTAIDNAIRAIYGIDAPGVDWGGVISGIGGLAGGLMSLFSDKRTKDQIYSGQACKDALARGDYALYNQLEAAAKGGLGSSGGAPPEIVGPGGINPELQKPAVSSGGAPPEIVGPGGINPELQKPAVSSGGSPPERVGPGGTNPELQKPAISSAPTSAPTLDGPGGIRPPMGVSSSPTAAPTLDGPGGIRPPMGVGGGGASAGLDFTTMPKLPTSGFGGGASAGLDTFNLPSMKPGQFDRDFAGKSQLSGLSGNLDIKKIEDLTNPRNIGTWDADKLGPALRTNRENLLGPDIVGPDRWKMRDPRYLYQPEESPYPSWDWFQKKYGAEPYNPTPEESGAMDLARGYGRNILDQWRSHFENQGAGTEGGGINLPDTAKGWKGGTWIGGDPSNKWIGNLDQDLLDKINKPYYGDSLKDQIVDLSKAKEYSPAGWNPSWNASNVLGLASAINQGVPAQLPEAYLKNLSNIQNLGQAINTQMTVPPALLKNVSNIQNLGQAIQTMPKAPTVPLAPIAPIKPSPLALVEEQKRLNLGKLGGLTFSGEACKDALMSGNMPLYNMLQEASKTPMFTGVEPPPAPQMPSLGARLGVKPGMIQAQMPEMAAKVGVDPSAQMPEIEGQMTLAEGGPVGPSGMNQMSFQQPPGAFAAEQEKSNLLNSVGGLTAAGKGLGNLLKGLGVGQPTKTTYMSPKAAGPWITSLWGPPKNSSMAAANKFFSDEKTKENMTAEDVFDFLDKMKAVKFKYKEPFASMMGANGARTGVYADDVEKSDLGSDMVTNDPVTGMKMLDTRPDKFNPLVMASLAHLHERLKKVEGGE